MHPGMIGMVVQTSTSVCASVFGTQLCQLFSTQLWSLLCAQCCSDGHGVHQLALVLQQSEYYRHTCTSYRTDVLQGTSPRHPVRQFPSPCRKPPKVLGIPLLCLVLVGNGLEMSSIVSPVHSFNHSLCSNFVFTAVNVAKPVGILVIKLKRHMIPTLHLEWWFVG